MSDAPQEPRREVSPERFAALEQRMIAKYGPERYAGLKAAVLGFAKTCAPGEWDEYVDALAGGRTTARGRPRHFVQATTGTPAPAWRVLRFRQTQSAFRMRRREGLDKRMEHWLARVRVALRLDCGAIEFVDDAVLLLSQARLERRPRSVAGDRGRFARGKADRKH